MSQVRIGLLGLGTVGTGVVKALRLQAEKLEKSLGKKLEIVKILVKDKDKQRDLAVSKALLTDRFKEVLEGDIDVVVEAMGGVEPAYTYIRQAIAKGCHVVTANKELLAKHGRELIRLANEQRVHFFYEASVAGGIPVLNVIRHFLQANELTKVQGIINGTTNYILTKMEKEQRSYREVLEEAQNLGYAEADPTADVEGFDALYKLYILSQLVFGEAQNIDEIKRCGISRLSLAEINLAKEMGYRFKLLAQACKEETGVRLSVGPSLIPLDHPLSGIDDVYNAVQITGNLVGDLLLTGRGAGEFPTASAMVEDLAYLLNRPFIPQREWREAAKVAACDDTGTKFVFIETNHPTFILESLKRQPVVILAAKIDRGKMGLIVKGAVSLPKASVYPVIGDSQVQAVEKEGKQSFVTL